MVFCLPPGEQFLSYPVAGLDNDLRPGYRRCNFVWYRPADDGALRAMLTDAGGRTHALGIPPPLVREEIIVAMRAAAPALLAPPLAELVRLSPLPFLQPIYDVESLRMVAGRVAILGDAAFLARPHVGAGVTKAAEDAMALAAALRENEDIATALSQFEQQRLSPNQRITARGRDLGAYLAPQATPEQRAIAKRHSPPEAVLREVALLNFLRGREFPNV
jgi:2-polyprenyl-6-methoxyphenol hydroxylase-like FAD-dependent oxidoreductase